MDPHTILFFFYCAVQQPDPNQPKPEGAEMALLKGEHLGVVSNWPPSLLTALHRWGTTQPKTPCLTSLDTTGKAVYTLTYGKKRPSFFLFLDHERIVALVNNAEYTQRFS